MSFNIDELHKIVFHYEYVKFVYCFSEFLFDILNDNSYISNIVDLFKNFHLLGNSFKYCKINKIVFVSIKYIHSNMQVYILN